MKENWKSLNITIVDDWTKIFVTNRPDINEIINYKVDNSIQQMKEDIGVWKIKTKK